MVDWMVEVYTIFDFMPDSYFLAVYIFDKYISWTNRILGNDNVHLIGTVAMFLSTKSEEIRPLFMKQVIEQIGHKAFDSAKVKAMEIEMMETLGWQTCLVTP